MLHYVTEIKKIEAYTLTLLFNTGETKSIDLKNKLIEWSQSPESSFTYLLDPNNFSNAHLNNDFGTIYWDNGIDLCPDVLYELATQSENKNAETSYSHTYSSTTYDAIDTNMKIVREKSKED